MNIDKIFNQYTTEEGVPFFLLSKSVFFPTDSSLEIYDYVYVEDDTPWTIMSYKLYGSIAYWWVLSSLNKQSQFYAKRGEVIQIISPEHLISVIKHV